MNSNRRNFLTKGLTSAAGMAAASLMPFDLFGRDIVTPEPIVLPPTKRAKPKNNIRFSVIGINHGHIYGMVNSLLDGGGKLVAV